jgi:Cytochrome P450
MLAMHENVQHRLAEEINEVFGEYKDLIIDYEKLSELKYVEMVIKETLRLFSPATGKLIYFSPHSRWLLQSLRRHFQGGESRRRFGERWHG